MKEGIHPEYYQATVTCNCGNTFVTGSTKRISMLKSAPNAIHSTQDSRKQQQHADVLINSIRNTASNNKRFGYRSIQMSCESRMYMLKIMRGVEVEKSQPFLSHGFFVWIF